MKEDTLFRSRVDDLLHQCENQHRVTSSTFLDLHLLNLATHHVKKPMNAYAFFWGGHEIAQRKVLFFFPEWTGVTSDEEALKHLKEFSNDNALTVLHCEKDKFSDELSHRDYLGSLMALGMKRENLGDFFIHEAGGDIVTLKTVAPFLEENVSTAGRASITATTVPIWDLHVTQQKIEEKEIIVPSLRLDAVLASAYSLSRSTATEFIVGRKVFINQVEALKTHDVLKDGDLVSVRGKGRFRVVEKVRKTRRGNKAVVVEKFI